MTSPILVRTKAYKFLAVNKYVISFCVTASSDNFLYRLLFIQLFIILQFTILMHLHTLDVHLDLGSVFSFCVTASSDNFLYRHLNLLVQPQGGRPPLEVHNSVLRGVPSRCLWRAPRSDR